MSQAIDFQSTDLGKPITNDKNSNGSRESPSRILLIALCVIGIIGLGCAAYGSTMLALHPINAIHNTAAIVMAAVGGSLALFGIAAAILLIKRSCERKKNETGPSINQFGQDAYTVREKEEKIKKTEAEKQTAQNSKQVPSELEVKKQEPQNKPGDNANVDMPKQQETQFPDKKEASSAQILYTEEEVIALVGQDTVNKWKSKPRELDTYYTFEDSDSKIFVLSSNIHNKKDIFFFRSLDERNKAQQHYETHCRLINQTELKKQLNKSTKNTLHRKEIDQYKLNTSTDYLPFELTVSGQTIFCIDLFPSEKFRCYRSATDRYENFIKGAEDPVTAEADKLIDMHDLDDKLKEFSKDYACFTCDHHHAFIFYKVDGEIKWQYIKRDSIESTKEKVDLKNNIFSKNKPGFAIQYYRNGYVTKLKTDHQLEEKIKTEHDFARFSDGSCVYLFYKKGSEIVSKIVAYDQTKETLEELQLTNEVGL